MSENQVETQPVESMEETQEAVTTLAKLQRISAEPTPFHEVRWRDADRQGSKQYPYTDPDYVIRTLNDIFGFHWSFIVEHEEMIYFADQPFEIKVRGRLIVPFEGRTITKMQYGAATIEYKSNGRPVMIADAYKSAASDALKKCASELGIAHDVYDSDSILHKGGRKGQNGSGGGTGTTGTTTQQSRQGQTQNQPGPKQTSNAQPKPLSLAELIPAIGKCWVDSGNHPDRFGEYMKSNLDGKSDAELRTALQTWQQHTEKKRGEVIEAIKNCYLSWSDRNTPALWESTQLPRLTGNVPELRQVLTQWQEAINKRASEAATSDNGSGKTSGLDQWACHNRSLALEVINATARLEKTGITPDQWRQELAQIFTEYEPPISRKSLSAEECKTVIATFNAWSQKRESEAATQQQAA